MHLSKPFRELRHQGLFIDAPMKSAGFPWTERTPPFIAAKTTSAAATIAVGLRLKVVRFVSVRHADMVELLQRVHFSIAILPRLLFVKEIEPHFSCLEFQ
jgi:hypothetical protein